MRFLRALTDLGSVIVAVGLFLFFVYRPGYTPPGDQGQMIGVIVALVIAAVYLVLEGMTVLKSDTPSALYFAIETEISHLPAYVMVIVGTLWWKGHIVLSLFQWVVAGIFTGVIAIDLLGFVAIVARQYLLTDEAKIVR